jgi:nucleotide-binding universal stress UspA family protein
MQNSIVCGVDGSQPSRSAAQVAAQLARTLNLRLILAYATEDRPTFPYGDRPLKELQRRRAIEDGREMLEAVAAELPADAPDMTVVFGTPVEGLSAVCSKEAAEVLVVGSRGRGRLATALLGSVSAQLASTSACPVLVVPALDAAERFQTREAKSGGAIVCGVDGSPESERALRVAAGLAERMMIELLPVYVDDGKRGGASVGDGGPVQVDHGEPIDGLRRRALGDDGRLIVVGSRGRGALSAAVLGSVSGALAASAPVPVLIVSPTASASALDDDVADRAEAEVLAAAQG